MTSANEGLRAVIIAAAKRAAVKNASTEAEHLDLLEVVEVRTALAEGMDEDGALTPVPNRPGYLWRDLPTGRIFVPFNLSPVFPGEVILTPIVAIGEKMRLGADSPFCLSGSTTFLGRFSGVGDLDFCEYYIADRAGLSDAVRDKQETPDPPLIFAKCTLKHQPPWTGLEADLLASYGGETTPRLMLEFIADVPMGPLPATSLVLATSDGEDGAAGQSFAHQEAVIPGTDPLRLLIAPEKLGGYVDWLRGQVRKILDKGEAEYGPQAPVKALKRCLSLMLMLGALDEVDDLLDELADTALQDVVMDVRLEELHTLASARGDLSETLMNRISSLESFAKQHTPEERESALRAAHDVARSMLITIDAWFEEIA